MVAAEQQPQALQPLPATIDLFLVIFIRYFVFRVMMKSIKGSCSRYDYFFIIHDILICDSSHSNFKNFVGFFCCSTRSCTDNAHHITVPITQLLHTCFSLEEWRITIHTSSIRLSTRKRTNKVAFHAGIYLSLFPNYLFYFTSFINLSYQRHA